LLLAAAVSAFVFVVIEFDQWGFRTAVIEFVNSFDPEYVDLTEREAELAGGVAELETRRLDAAAEDERLEALRLELERREALLEAKEEQGAQESANAPGYWLGLSPQEIEDMESLAKTYAAMDPVAAAEIMAELYTSNDAAAILYHMAEKSAGPILEAMDRQLAAAVTEALLNSN
jgi:flagellar motility protein MotE (MotC chaperone)